MEYSLEMEVVDIMNVRVEINIVGHSLGGWIAGEYSLHYPNNIAKVSLVCSVGVYKHDKTWFGDRIGVLGIFMEFTRGLFGINWPFKLLRFKIL